MWIVNGKEIKLRCLIDCEAKDVDRLAIELAEISRLQAIDAINKARRLETL